MDRISTIEYKEKKILFADFSFAGKKEEVLEVIEDYKKFIVQFEEGTVLTLTNFDQAYFDQQINVELKELLKHNKKYVVKSAIIGVSTARKLFLETTAALTGRKLGVFKTIEEAKEYLSADN